jgi:hypothetical protein
LNIAPEYARSRGTRGFIKSPPFSKSERYELVAHIVGSTRGSSVREWIGDTTIIAIDDKHRQVCRRMGMDLFDAQPLTVLGDQNKLFSIHVSDAMPRSQEHVSGGPLYCRILSFDSALVEYEPIYHREDGSERLGSHRWLPIAGFIEETFGGWYEGTWPPPAIVRAPRPGLLVPMDPRKIGSRPADS